MIQKVKLKDIALYSKGKQINKEDLLDDGEYDYLNGGINPSGRTNKTNCEANTITISEGGNSCGYINYMMYPFWCGAHCYYLYNTVENTKYLYYALKSQQNGIQNLRSGACMPNIKKSDLGNLEILFDDDEHEQMRITNILDNLGQIITYRKKELTKLDDLIKARFVEMFGDAVDNPMRWNKKQLQEIVTDDCTISYGIVQTGEDQKDGVPVFRPVDIVNRIPKLEELKKTTEKISNKYKKTILKGREMLITVRANIAETCIVGEEFKGCNVGRGIVPIRTKEDIMVLEFLKCILDSKHINDDIKRKAKGITLIQLNMQDLREIELIIPPIEKQKAYVQFAKQVDKSKVISENQLKNIAILLTICSTIYI